jgi:hypothetical protein
MHEDRKILDALDPLDVAASDKVNEINVHEE